MSTTASRPSSRRPRAQTQIDSRRKRPAASPSTWGSPAPSFRGPQCVVHRRAGPHPLPKNIAGVGGVDAVSSWSRDRGVEAPVEEHLRILSLLGISHGIVALTKVGQAGDELAELAHMEMGAPGDLPRACPRGSVDAIDGIGGPFVMRSTACSTVIDCSRPQATPPLDRPGLCGEGAARSSPEHSPAAWSVSRTRSWPCPEAMTCESERSKVSTPNGPRWVPVIGLRRTSRACLTINSPGAMCSCGMETGISPAGSTPPSQGSTLSTGRSAAGAHLLYLALASTFGSVLGPDTIDPGATGFVRCLPVALPLVRATGSSARVGAGGHPRRWGDPRCGPTGRRLALFLTVRRTGDSRARPSRCRPFASPDRRTLRADVGRWAVDPTELAQVAADLRSAVSDADALGLDLAPLDEFDEPFSTRSMTWSSKEGESARRRRRPLGRHGVVARRPNRSLAAIDDVDPAEIGAFVEVTSFSSTAWCSPTALDDAVAPSPVCWLRHRTGSPLRWLRRLGHHPQVRHPADHPARRNWRHPSTRRSRIAGPRLPEIRTRLVQTRLRWRRSVSDMPPRFRGAHESSWRTQGIRRALSNLHRSALRLLAEPLLIAALGCGRRKKHHRLRPATRGPNLPVHVCAVAIRSLLSEDGAIRLRRMSQMLFVGASILATLREIRRSFASPAQIGHGCAPIGRRRTG